MKRSYLFTEEGEHTRVQLARDIYMCFPFARDSFSVRSSLERPFVRSSMRHFLRRRRRLYPTLRRNIPVTLPRLGSWRPLPSGSFYKVLFFRNAGPTIVFLRYAFAHSYRFLQSGPRYIGTLPIPSFSASDFVLPPRHARLESVFCREFTRSLGYSYVVAALRRLAG